MRPGPSNDNYDRRSTDADNLSDEELRQLLNNNKVRVAPIRQPAPKKHIDLDALLGNNER